jgi:hypothetical protein
VSHFNLYGLDKGKLPSYGLGTLGGGGPSFAGVFPEVSPSDPSHLIIAD